MKVFYIRYKDFELKVRQDLSPSGEILGHYFWHSNNPGWKESLRQCYTGWSFQDEELNSQREKLAELWKEAGIELDELLRDIGEGDIIVFHDDGSIHVEDLEDMEFDSEKEAERFCKAHPLRGGFYVFQYLKSGKVRIYAIPSTYCAPDPDEIPEDVYEEELREPDGSKITAW